MDRKASLFIIGEALTHSSVFIDAFVDGTYDFRPMLQYIKPISSRYDLAYYDQETIFMGEGYELSGYPAFNSPHEVADAFIDAGFNLISSTTNHTMDYGEVGVLNNLKYWDTQKDKVVFAGQSSSWEEREKYVNTIHEVNGIRYAFLAYTTKTNEQIPPEGKEYLTNIYSDEKAASDISKIRGKADFIIVAMHWGDDYSVDPCPEQEHIARHLSDLGVGLILGTHTHVVQPVEYINGGKTLVLYSLGNCLSNQRELITRVGLMASLDIIKTDDATRLDNLRVDFLYCKNKPEGKRDYRVHPCTPDIVEKMPELEILTELHDVVSSRYPDITWGIKP